MTPMLIRIQIPESTCAESSYFHQEVDTCVPILGASQALIARISSAQVSFPPDRTLCSRDGIHDNPERFTLAAQHRVILEVEEQLP